MASLKTIKAKIRSIKKTGKVTKAMEAVSAAKMRKAQTTAIKGRAYARAATSILARVSGTQGLVNHPLTRGSKRLPAPASGHSGDASASNLSSPRKALYICNNFRQRACGCSKFERASRNLSRHCGAWSHSKACFCCGDRA